MTQPLELAERRRCQSIELTNMVPRKFSPVSSSEYWRAFQAGFAVAILATTVLAKPPADADTQWVYSGPEKVVWSSVGLAQILTDHSIELQKKANGWQEFTLYFRPPEHAQISRVSLEVLPSVPSRKEGDHRVVLFEVKANLESDQKAATQLEFKSCRFAGNEADDTAANCIDFLSDTGWTVPDFVGNDACHQLVFELSEPITVQRNNMFAITIDSGNAPDIKALSRVRVAFAGTSIVANEHPKPPISLEPKFEAHLSTEKRSSSFGARQASF